jgi:hypothetical protein
MKFASRLSLLLAVSLSASLAQAEEATLWNIRIDEPTRVSSYDQLFTLQLSQFKPVSLQLTNGTYNFNYGDHVSSAMAEAGWALKVADFASYGSFYLEGNLAFSAFGGSSVQASGPTSGGSSYSLDLFGVDARLMYAGDWFPWKRLTPFVDGGYLYTVFYQPGNSGMDSVTGGVGNPVAGAGLRLWLNRTTALRSGGNAFYLTGKFNRIFPANDGVNLASSSVFGGVSLGL